MKLTSFLQRVDKILSSLAGCDQHGTSTVTNSWSGVKQSDERSAYRSVVPHEYGPERGAI